MDGAQLLTAPSCDAAAGAQMGTAQLHLEPGRDLAAAAPTNNVSSTIASPPIASPHVMDDDNVSTSTDSDVPAEGDDNEEEIVHDDDDPQFPLVPAVPADVALQRLIMETLFTYPPLPTSLNSHATRPPHYGPAERRTVPPHLAPQPQQPRATIGPSLEDLDVVRLLCMHLGYCYIWVTGQCPTHCTEIARCSLLHPYSLDLNALPLTPGSNVALTEAPPVHAKQSMLSPLLARTAWSRVWTWRGIVQRATAQLSYTSYYDDAMSSPGTPRFTRLSRLGTPGNKVILMLPSSNTI